MPFHFFFVWSCYGVVRRVLESGGEGGRVRLAALSRFHSPCKIVALHQNYPTLAPGGLSASRGRPLSFFWLLGGHISFLAQTWFFFNGETPSSKRRSCNSTLQNLGVGFPPPIPFQSLMFQVGTPGPKSVVFSF